MTVSKNFEISGRANDVDNQNVYSSTAVLSFSNRSFGNSGKSFFSGLCPISDC